MNNIRISKNFHLREFETRSTKEVKLDSELLDKLQKLRDHFGRPCIVTSGYRNKQDNDRVGGSVQSQHMQGKAADIRIQVISHQNVYNQALKMGFGGIGIYNDHVHVDVRSHGPSRWDERS